MNDCSCSTGFTTRIQVFVRDRKSCLPVLVFIIHYLAANYSRALHPSTAAAQDRIRPIHWDLRRRVGEGLQCIGRKDKSRFWCDLSFGAFMSSEPVLVSDSPRERFGIPLPMFCEPSLSVWEILLTSVFFM